MLAIATATGGGGEGSVTGWGNVARKALRTQPHKRERYWAVDHEAWTLVWLLALLSDIAQATLPLWAWRLAPTPLSWGQGPAQFCTV